MSNNNNNNNNNNHNSSSSSTTTATKRKLSNSSQSNKRIKTKPSYFRQRVLPNPPKVNYSQPVALPDGSNVVLTDEHKKKLETDGYCVVDNVLNSSECKDYEDKFWTWLEQLGTGIKAKDWSTWTKDRIPLQNRGIVEFPSIVHSDFIWELRCHPNVRSVFTQLWNDSDLLVGFCRARLIPPSIINTEKKDNLWLHVDQGSRRRGLACIQGVVNLIDSDQDTDAGLVVVPGSHLYHDKFFKTHDLAVSREWYKYSASELQWFYEQKDSNQQHLKPIKVNAKAGSIILWDSRTIHCNKAPEANQINTNRAGMAVFICMTPRKWCTSNDILLKKQQAFQQVAFASHWPHIVQYIQKNEPPFRTNGVDCSKFKHIQTQPPTLNAIGLRLAGYD